VGSSIDDIEGRARDDEFIGWHASELGDILVKRYSGFSSSGSG